MGCTDHRVHHGDIGQRIGSAAFHSWVLPQVSGAHARFSGSELLLRLAGIVKLSAQGDIAYSADSLYR